VKSDHLKTGKVFKVHVFAIEGCEMRKLNKNVISDIETLMCVYVLKPGWQH